jgi:hypothetical protein
MKIASHNSFTYLRPRRWYMRPFAFMARCQRWPLLRYLDDLCPKVYALAHNRRNIWRGTTHDWLFIDFVDIQ